ncbi:GntR family transcriptional regulator [Streptomyces werraensis]|uniref:GntR family transcriptional regulator n=1 Tax=Streptomyces werraensis TaxID=68284 RepID=UPI0036F98D06
MSKTVGYAEIAAHLRQQIQDGTLRPGDTLPSFKKISAEYEVAITTVNRAFRLLKEEGLTVAKPGVGTVVADPVGPLGSMAADTADSDRQLSRGLVAFIEQQEHDPHTELGDCIKLVAASVWHAAWRQARADQHPDPEIERQVDQLIEGSDFLRDALRRHNWRNVSAVLGAFRDAGLAGSADVPAFYTHVNHIPDH